MNLDMYLEMFKIDRETFENSHAITAGKAAQNELALLR
jgi:hypothetical protein